MTAKETVSIDSFISSSLGGYINGIQLAKFGLLIDRTPSIYLKVRLKDLASVFFFVFWSTVDFVIMHRAQYIIYLHFYYIPHNKVHQQTASRSTQCHVGFDPRSAVLKIVNCWFSAKHTLLLNKS
jgi:hypothetical protein